MHPPEIYFSSVPLDVKKCVETENIQGVNHRAALYKRANEAILEKPNPYDDGQGWVNTHEGVLEPMWSFGTIMPTSLVDLLVTCDREVVEEEEEEEERDDGDMDNIELDDLIDSDDE